MVRADTHLVLVGLMGSGKSTVGRVLAERLGRPLFDTDLMIESDTGRSVRDIFATDGEPAFRSLETDALRHALASEVPAVIAGAGGVVLAEANRELLHESRARVVWLRADPVLLVERTRHGGHRPLLDDDPTAALLAMAAVREPLYREVADLVVTVEGRSPADVVEAILR